MLVPRPSAGLPLIARPAASVVTWIVLMTARPFGWDQPRPSMMVGIARIHRSIAMIHDLRGTPRGERGASGGKLSLLKSKAHYPPNNFDGRAQGQTVSKSPKHRGWIR